MGIIIFRDPKRHENGYSDPEEFYYWNLDDFVDYEDAESYYYAHGGE